MIRTDAELEQNLELIQGMYRALMHLHTRVAPQNFANYQILSEGPVDEIRKLQREINDYLGIAELSSIETRSD